jgi:hypothetical protein
LGIGEDVEVVAVIAKEVEVFLGDVHVSLAGV